MTSPNPNGFKEREKRAKWKHKPLVREIEATWNQPIPKHSRNAIPWLALRSLVDDLTERLPVKLVKALYGVVDNKDLAGYLKLGAEWGSPQLYDFPGSYFAAISVLNLLKKTPMGAEGLDPNAEALRRFRIAEMRCRQANRRMLHFRNFDYSDSRPLTKRLRVHEVLHLARRKIQSWLGPLNVREVLSGVRHGPGGVVGLKRPFTTPYYKFSVSDYTVSGGAYWYAVRTVASQDAWVRTLAEERGMTTTAEQFRCVPWETKVRLVDGRVSIADYNEVTFVPKNAKTHRSIAIEPHLNVVLQLSVGSFLKDRLRLAGCDLKDQGRNQELARIGSIQQESKDPVTLDLEMASDTMCIELVRELLPIEWFEFLDCLRSHSGQLSGKRQVWAKFSSMGNGFTFELESMIFYAIAQAVSDLHGTTEWFSDTFGPAFKYAYVSVYGDDIIVPAEISHHLVQVLRFVGFRVNEEKSFTTGLFRESCGMDYFAGVNVRPFNLERPMSRVGDLIHLHNGLKWLGTQRGIALPIGRTIALIRGLIPEAVRLHLVGKEPTIDDAYVWVAPDECHRSKLVLWDRDHMNWIFPYVRQGSEVRRGQAHYRYLQFLYSNTDKGIAEALDRSEEFTPHWDLRHVSAGGSAGDVVISGGGRGKLAFHG